METVNNLDQTSIAFINDKSPILDLTNNDLVASGIEVLFRSETIEDGLPQLSALKELPKVCIIDLDFYDRNVLKQLQELRKLVGVVNLPEDFDEKAELRSALEKKHL